MRKRLKQFQLYILMIFFWIILSGGVDIKVILYGTVFSALIIRMVYHVMFELDDNIIKLPPTWRFIWFGYIVLVAIVKSSIDHIFRIIKNESAYETFEVTLDTNNIVIITLIANAITLTPGTITLNVNEQTLEVIGFSRGKDDIESMKQDILHFQKPFLYRRR